MLEVAEEAMSINSSNNRSESLAIVRSWSTDAFFECYCVPLVDLGIEYRPKAPYKFTIDPDLDRIGQHEN